MRIFNPKSWIRKLYSFRKMGTGSGLVAVMNQVLLLLLLYATKSNADPRSNSLMIQCSKVRQHNVTVFVPNLLNSIDAVLNQLRTGPNGSAVAVAGSGSDATYVLAECYGDLSQHDCALCYTQAWMVGTDCFPSNGGTVFLDGCYTRAENYSFFDQIFGPLDRVNCTDSKPKSNGFSDLTNQILDRMVAEASGSGSGFSQATAKLGKQSVYGLANCWSTVNSSRCRECLTNASIAIRGCLPGSGGRAMYTGCFLRYSDTDFLNSYSTGSRERVGISVMVIGATSFVTLAVVGTVILTYFLKQKRLAEMRKANSPKGEQKLSNSNIHFNYSALEKATGNFSTCNKLGRGGFGTVYKGVLADGREVAVKRLIFNTTQRISGFYNEVNMISKIEHKNLLRLLGCSCNGPESLLVYEYVPNQSLDRFIFDPENAKKLNWEKRMNIIIGTAEGLMYLHENSEIKIIHRDIKASNILLDTKFHAKIADFGLARSFEDDKSQIITVVAGTRGYMSPEYLAHGQLTKKADVYSFGVLLLEIVTGVQNNQSMVKDDIESTLSTSWRHFQSQTVQEIIDPNLMIGDAHENGTIAREAVKVVHVGLLCAQADSALRPSMRRALEMLLRRDNTLPPPSRPPFLEETGADPHRTFGSACSAAVVSYSSFYPR